MPHCVIEYSRDVEESANIPNLCQKLHRVLIDSELFESKSIKTRARAYDDYVISCDEGRSGFVHITAHILSGRSLENRQALSENLFEAAREILPQIGCLTVDINEMDRDTYRK